MKKRIVPKALTIALAVSLAAHLVTFAVAENATSKLGSENAACPTREEFFTAIAQSLGMEGSYEYNSEFPDYTGTNDYVNEMISKGYVIGRNTGLLDLNDILTSEDMNFVLTRIEWPKEKVEVKTTITNTVEVPVMQNLPYVDEALNCEHLFYLSSDGGYKCVYENCNLEYPVGTMIIPSIPADLLSNLGSVPEDPSVLSPETSAYIDEEWICLDDGIMQYPIACNAECYVQGDPIGFFELFQTYGSVIGSESYLIVRYHLVNVYGIDYIDWIDITG